MSRKSNTKKRRRRGFLSSLFCCFGSRSPNPNQDIKRNGSTIANHEAQSADLSADEKDNKVRYLNNFSILKFTFRFKFNDIFTRCLSIWPISMSCSFKFLAQTTRFFHNLLRKRAASEAIICRCELRRAWCIGFQGTLTAPNSEIKNLDVM